MLLKPCHFKLMISLRTCIITLRKGTRWRFPCQSMFGYWLLTLFSFLQHETSWNTERLFLRRWVQSDTPSLPYQMALSQALCWEDATSLAAFVCLLQGPWGSRFSWNGQIYQEDSWGWSNAPNSIFLSWCSEADWCLRPSVSSKLVTLSLQYAEWVLEDEIHIMMF